MSIDFSTQDESLFANQINENHDSEVNPISRKRDYQHSNLKSVNNDHENNKKIRTNGSTNPTQPKYKHKKTKTKHKKKTKKKKKTRTSSSTKNTIKSHNKKKHKHKHRHKHKNKRKKKDQNEIKINTSEINPFLMMQELFQDISQTTKHNPLVNAKIEREKQSIELVRDIQYQQKKNVKNEKTVKEYTPPECSICLDEIEEDGVSTTCGHVFHDDCIRDWLSRKQVCPNCNDKVNTKDLEKINFTKLN
ncbi:praja ring finger ubiquitin ligase [Anaeramoeba flamelloides]|uniref:Praja ring finger ubiquitin ligase n=1 Tax=Anaeramoeba flamelloides TaxID=1746091 RepID=A0AAV8A6T7_9EUKA|nr:praja ring finger ubiquitin ligase [Anaeramoeba flamelloides]